MKLVGLKIRMDRLFLSSLLEPLKLADREVNVLCLLLTGALRANSAVEPAVSGAGKHRRASTLPAEPAVEPVVSGAGALPAEPAVELVELVSDLESLSFSLESIIADPSVDYHEVIVKKDEQFKDIRFGNMTLNQIEAYKEMLSQVPDAESTWLQSFDDSTARGYEDRKAANEIRGAYMWNQGSMTLVRVNLRIMEVLLKENTRIWPRYYDLVRCNMRSMTNDRFYGTPDNFKSVRVPALCMGAPVDEREFFRAGQSHQDETIGIFEDTYEVPGSQYGGCISLIKLNGTH